METAVNPVFASMPTGGVVNRTAQLFRLCTYGGGAGVLLVDGSSGSRTGGGAGWDISGPDQVTAGTPSQAGPACSSSTCT